MARKKTEQQKKDQADAVLADYRKQGRSLLSDVLPGADNRSLRDRVARGESLLVQDKRTGQKVVLSTRPIAGTAEHEVVATAAVSRNPGLTSDIVNDFDDFSQAQTNDATQTADMYWRVYRNEGVIANAVSTLCALLASGVSLKVRRAKKGKQKKAKEELQGALDAFTLRVNNAPDDGVVKGGRGLKNLTISAARQALVEGSWIGRSVWTEHAVPSVGKSFSLPMTIQSISVRHIQPVQELVGTGIEAFYWVPDNTLLQNYNAPKTKEVGQMLKRFLPRDIVKQLTDNNGKALLDPALMLHVRHRGNDTDAFGDSIIGPAMWAVLWKRALEQADLVGMRSLINRLTIVKVGNENPPYNTPEVQQVRAALMQTFFEDTGPNMTIIWQGNDVEVVDVGAHQKMLDIDERLKIADQKLKLAIGVPDALLAGQGDGAKASGLAAMLAAATKIDELRSAFAETWTTMGERIAFENGFQDVEIICEFDNVLQIDRMEEWNQRRLDYQMGVVSIRSYLKALNYDPEAMFLEKCQEQGIEPDENTKWNEVFNPIAGLPGQGIPGPDGKALPPGQGPGKPPGQGRTPDGVTGKPTSERPPESKKPVENK